MLRKFTKVALAGAFGLLAVVLAQSASVRAEDKKDDKAPTVKEIMAKGHKGTDALMAKIKTEAKDGKWEEAVSHAKALAVFGEHLGKNKPNKGDAASWEKLTKKYAESTKAALKATEDKDAKAVNKALMINCKECHDAHK